jgi:hypothetical protein
MHVVNIRVSPTKPFWDETVVSLSFPELYKVCHRLSLSQQIVSRPPAIIKATTTPWRLGLAVPVH